MHNWGVWLAEGHQPASHAVMAESVRNDRLLQKAHSLICSHCETSFGTIAVRRAPVQGVPFMSQVLTSENSDVFLSYAREDVVAAQKLAALLEANGLTVWWDRRLVAGDAINTTIERAIDGAKAVIVLWSPHSIASRWVNGEAETAAEAGKLLPVKIAECRSPLNFRTLHTPEVFRSSEQLAEMAQLLSVKLRPNAPVDRQIKLSAVSTDTFLRDLGKTLADQNPDFWSQMRSEAEWCRRHPAACVAIVAAYVALVAAVSITQNVDFAAVNGGCTLLILLGYWLYRRHRLAKAATSK
jgi:TIR domain